MGWIGSFILALIAMNATAAPPTLESLACASGPACVAQGMKHLEAKEYVKSRPFFEAACADKVPMGCQNLGVIFMQGLGVEKNPKQAFVHFERACLLGGVEMCKVIGLDHYRGTTFSKNYPKALEMFKAGCPKNDRASCYIGGMMLVDQKLGFTDIPLGIQFLEKGCALGEGPACEGLGRVHFTGQGVAADQEKGKAFFKKGCDLKHQVSCDLFTKVSAPPPKARSFNLTVSSLSADGLEARDLKCQLPKSNMFSSMLIVGGLAKQKDALNACANGAKLSPRVAMTFAGNRPTNVQVKDVSAQVGTCVRQALTKVQVNTSGYCEVTLPIGN